MYKNFLIVVLVIGLALAAGAQTADSKLLSVYSQEKLDIMEANAPGSIDYLNFYVNHAYVVVDAPQGKNLVVEELYLINPLTLEKVTNLVYLQDLENFNPLQYSCTTNGESSFYSIIGSSKILMMYSQPVLQEKYRITQQQK